MAFAEELVKLGKELDFVIFEDRKFADIGGVIYLFVDIAFLPLFPLFSCPSSSFALLHCFCADLGSFSNPSSPKLELTFLLVIHVPSSGCHRCRPLLPITILPLLPYPSLYSPSPLPAPRPTPAAPRQYRHPPILFRHTPHLHLVRPHQRAPPPRPRDNNRSIHHRSSPRSCTTPSRRDVVERQSRDWLVHPVRSEDGA